MGKIIRLDHDLINKIAAGEVVERPASVVKELIENSIDAGANNIFIEIENAGKHKILVKDNGEGMTREDALLSVERHATSKIKKIDDLFHISTLGFRGEALASIASVSDLTIVTNAGNALGIKLVIEDLEIKAQEVASPKGTTVIVKNLFFNTPARRKYLGSDATELKLVIDIVSKYALAYPHISIRLIHNELEVLNAPAGSLIDKILAVYGREMAENLIPIEHDGVLGIKGYIGNTHILKKTRDYQSFFINGRFIRSDIIRQALESAYGSMLFLDRKPFAVLNFIINPNKIDANVHPAKLHVKFDNAEFVKEEITKVLGDILSQNDMFMEKVKEKQFPLLKMFSKEKAKKPYAPQKASQALLKESPKEYDFKVIGQIHKTYIGIETDDGLLIVDQHAAAERINLEKIEGMMKLENKSQMLLSPVILRPQKKDFALINELLPKLESFGFELEPFGGEEFILRKVPVMFRQEMDRNGLNDFFDELSENIKKSRKGFVDDEIIYTMACKASIKANEELSVKQMYDLIEQLFLTKLPYSCAHGRPTMLKFTGHELEKMFKRK
jgi:DNA mismatch repair protein MutL